MIIVLIGPCGCGKTTIGSRLSKVIGWDFIDADDYHNEANRAKMKKGIGLNDEDRLPWLAAVHAEIGKRSQLVLACSALKRRYREILMGGTCGEVLTDVFFILLEANAETLRQRLAQRKDHFMSASLLQSQLDALESFTPEENGVVLDGNCSIEHVVDEISNIIQGFSSSICR